MTVINIIADRDTYVDQDFPSANFGNSEELGMGYGWTPPGFGIIFDKRAFLHFTIPETPIGMVIDYALLYLYVEVAQSSSNNINSLTADWGEYSLNWNNKPEVIHQADESFRDYSVGWNEVSIIDFVNAWLTNNFHGHPFPNYGISIGRGDAQPYTTYISSREKAGYKPYIKINYKFPEYIGSSQIID